MDQKGTIGDCWWDFSNIFHQIAHCTLDDLDFSNRFLGEILITQTTGYIYWNMVEKNQCCLLCCFFLLLLLLLFLFIYFFFRFKVQYASEQLKRTQEDYNNVFKQMQKTSEHLKETMAEIAKIDMETVCKKIYIFAAVICAW